jgi:DNA-directed RNA polymerase specialized sigma24 family protein
MSPFNPGSADWPLVAQCLTGDKAAWHRLYVGHYRLLAGQVRWMLERDAGVAAEVAHDVLVSLWLNDCRRLRAFDPARGRLRTYLFVLARQAVWLVRRSRVRRLAAVLPPEDLETICVPAAPWDDSVEEFLATLSERNRAFFRWQYLDGPDAPCPEQFAPANVRKRRQRLRACFMAFLAEANAEPRNSLEKR